MTEFDKQLIEKAKKLGRYQYDLIRMLRYVADSEEARRELTDLSDFYYERTLETI